MRPWDKFLNDLIGITEKCVQNMKPSDDEKNLTENGEKNEEVQILDEFDNPSIEKLVEFPERLAEEADQNASVINECNSELISEQENQLQLDEFSSRETVRKLVDVDDETLQRLISLCEKKDCFVQLNGNTEDMQMYCLANGIKADFTVNRRQFLRYKEKRKVETNEQDYSWHPKGKKRKEYETEAILDYDVSSEKYLVKWIGWAHADNTWEPENHLESSKDLLDDFRTKEEEFKRNNLALEWNNKVLRLQLFLTQITSKDYDDVRVFRKLFKESLGSTNFNLKLAKSKISTTMKILDEIKENSFRFCTMGSKRVASIVCDELKIDENFGSLDKFFEFVEKCKSVNEELKEWEKEINATIKQEGKSRNVYVENTVDLEGRPPDFTYINECKMNINDEENKRFEELNKNPVSWCQHDDCYADKKNCCPMFLDSKHVYTKEGSLRDAVMQPIVECNSKCSCGDDCSNRIIQKGTQVELIIFRTDNGRGWGVKAKERIRAKRFVMEYVGEVISIEESDKRGKLYDAAGRTYLFDLDFDVEAECVYSVDATKYGNVSHFVNHSCDPNLEVYVAWVNHLERQLPRLVFFSKRQIAKGEELTFDYKMTRPDSRSNDVQIECKCGASNCKKFLCI